MTLLVRPMARPEAFAIAAGPSGGVSVAGGDARGLYYGVGKLLRGAAFGAGFTSQGRRCQSAQTTHAIRRPSLYALYGQSPMK